MPDNTNKPGIGAWYGLVLGLALLKLWLVDAQGLTAISSAIHDDRLFLVLANDIAQFRWLGDYHKLTLVKGPFYPIWIAFCFAAGIPLLLAQHVLYIAGCLVFIQALQPRFTRSWVLLTVYLVLLFNPMSFTDQVMTRVIRDGIYPALTIVITAALLALVLRQKQSVRHLLPWAIMGGLALAAFWLTREEGVWLIPLLIVLLFKPLVSALRNKNWPQLVVFLLPVIVLIAAVQSVSLLNKVHYGVYTVVELKTPEYQAAYGALARVIHEDYLDRVPVPAETRRRIYQHSPAFAELKPFFEHSRFWRATKSIDDEIPGAWFIWALRGAAGRAGYHDSAASAAQYYRRLAAEVNKACAEQRLQCLPERATFLPPLRSEYLLPWLQTFAIAWYKIITLSDFRAYPSASHGPDEGFDLFRDLTRERLALDKWTLQKKMPRQYFVNQIKLQTLTIIGRVYQWTVPSLAGSALLFYVLLSFRVVRQKRHNCWWWLITALLAGITTRIIILTLIQVTSFNALNALYLAPIFPLLLICIVLPLLWFNDRHD